MNLFASAKLSLTNNEAAVMRELARVYHSVLCSRDELEWAAVLEDVIRKLELAAGQREVFFYREVAEAAISLPRCPQQETVLTPRVVFSPAGISVNGRVLRTVSATPGSLIVEIPRDLLDEAPATDALTWLDAIVLLAICANVGGGAIGARQVTAAAAAKIVALRGPGQVDVYGIAREHRLLDGVRLPTIAIQSKAYVVGSVLRAGTRRMFVTTKGVIDTDGSDVDAEDFAELGDVVVPQ